MSVLLNILQDSSFSNQITFILHIQGVFSLPGRGFHQRVMLISSVPMTLDDVIIALVSVDGCSSFSDPDGFFDVPDSSVGFLVYKLCHVSESTHEKTKWRHQQKIQRLETKRDRINDADLTGTQLKRWVINLSIYKLSRNQNKILVKGLNYAVTPEKIPTEEFVVAAEQATWSLPQEQKDKLRADVTGVLKSAKVPKQNITRQERTALKGLQKEKSITILPADKGKATVIMETREYQEKIKEMLNDEATYEKLKKDPTKKYKAELIRMVNSLEKEGKITKDQYWYLYPTLEKVCMDHQKSIRRECHSDQLLTTHRQ